MRIDMQMTIDKQDFHQSGWWATDPDFVLRALRAQLKAAAVLWPELADFQIVEKQPGKARGGAKGAAARAAALSPERRSEIASGAAKARWAGQ